MVTPPDFKLAICAFNKNVEVQRFFNICCSAKKNIYMVFLKQITKEFSFTFDRTS